MVEAEDADEGSLEGIYEGNPTSITRYELCENANERGHGAITYSLGYPRPAVSSQDTVYASMTAQAVAHLATLQDKYELSR